MTWSSTSGWQPAIGNGSVSDSPAAFLDDIVAYPSEHVFLLKDFHPFLDDEGVAMVGVEAAGHGIETGQHAASLNAGSPGVLHGNRTYLLQDEDGQINEVHSISAGLDYPGIGPEHSWLKEAGRVDYEPITDGEALEAFQLCSKLEGIIPALEPAHAVAYVGKIAPTLPKDHLIVMNMCGRGDKDIFTVAEALETEI